MRTVCKVQVPSDEIVDMIAMRNGLVAAFRAMTMSRLVSVARVRRGAGRGIFSGDGKDMFVDMVVMNMVEMPIVQVIGVAVMRDRLMAAACRVAMGMMVVSGMCAHRWTPWGKVAKSLRT